MNSHKPSYMQCRWIKTIPLAIWSNFAKTKGVNNYYPSELPFLGLQSPFHTSLSLFHDNILNVFGTREFETTQSPDLNKHVRDYLNRV